MDSKQRGKHLNREHESKQGEMEVNVLDSKYNINIILRLHENNLIVTATGNIAEEDQFKHLVQSIRVLLEGRYMGGIHYTNDYDRDGKSFLPHLSSSSPSPFLP